MGVLELSKGLLVIVEGSVRRVLFFLTRCSVFVRIFGGVLSQFLLFQKERVIKGDGGVLGAFLMHGEGDCVRVVTYLK